MEWRKNSPASRYAARSISAHNVPLLRTQRPFFTKSVPADASAPPSCPARPTHSHFQLLLLLCLPTCRTSSSSGNNPSTPSRTTCAVGVGIVTFPALIAAKIQHICIRIRDRFHVPVHVRAALMHWFIGSLTTYKHGIRNHPLLTSKNITSIAFLCYSMKNDGTCSLFAVQLYYFRLCLATFPLLHREMRPWTMLRKLSAIVTPLRGSR